HSREASRADPPELVARGELLDERGHVDDQRHALISEVGGAREAADLLEARAERLDDDVLLPVELVDDEAHPTRAHLAHDDELPTGGLVRPEPEETIEATDGERRPAKREDLAPLDSPE